MIRPIRVGLIAEGETELGASIPYIKPEDGGTVIAREKEGALHTLIRRELNTLGLPDCNFIHRHPSIKERGVKLRTGFSILDQKYLAQIVSVWKPEEVDLIVIVVDSDDNLLKRQHELKSALDTIRDNHLNNQNQSIADRSAGGLAIKNFETWLLADTQTVSEILGIELEELENLEDLNETKELFENAIAKSKYLAELQGNQRSLKIRWSLAFQIDLAVIKTCCPNGYVIFTESLMIAARVVTDMLKQS